MEITISSRQTIRPSSPTPHHLRHLQLSLIDQYSPPPQVHIQALFFFSADGDVNRFESTNMSARLKKSLSEVLTEFYPLAGEFSNNNSIYCNDGGLEYLEARVDRPLTLAQFLTSPQHKELRKLLPHDLYGAAVDRLSAVQVTVFDDCGSMAIGVSISHLLGDGSSLGVFVDRWAALARGDGMTIHNNTLPPKFGFASLFPPRDLPVQQQIVINTDRPRPNVVTKRFVFDRMKIEALKAAHFVYKYPTRVEAVSALIFKCLMSVGKLVPWKTVVLTMAVNLRSRSRPPLPAQYFGNLALACKVTNVGPDSTLNDFGVGIRKSIKEIDSDYFQNLQADNGLLNDLLQEDRQLLKRNDIRMIRLTSWCKFPIYQVDVGWGVPTWAATFYLNHPGVIKLLDAKNGDGIEAWVSLHEDDMARFECLPQLVEFSSANPAVLL